MHVIIRHRIGRQLTFPRDRSAEDRGVLVVLGDSGGVQVTEENLLKVVADGDFAVFAAFVVEGEDPLVAFAGEVLHPKPGHGPNPGAGVRQDRQNRPVPDPHERRDIDGFEEFPGVFDGNLGRFAFADLVALVADRTDGIQDDGVSFDLEVEKVVQTGPVELFGWD